MSVKEAMEQIQGTVNSALNVQVQTATQQLRDLVNSVKITAQAFTPALTTATMQACKQLTVGCTTPASALPSLRWSAIPNFLGDMFRPAFRETVTQLQSILVKQNSIFPQWASFNPYRAFNVNRACQQVTWLKFAYMAITLDGLSPRSTSSPQELSAMLESHSRLTSIWDSLGISSWIQEQLAAIEPWVAQLRARRDEHIVELFFKLLRGAIGRFPEVAHAAQANQVSGLLTTVQPCAP